MMPARVRGVLPGPCFALLAVAALAAGCPAEKAEQCDPACDPANCVFFEGWQCVEPSGSSSSGDAGTSGSASTTGSTPTEATGATEATGPTGSESSTGGLPVGCEGDTPRVRLVTSMGDMVVMLDAVNAPISVANFIHYVESDFYAGTIFHRVLDGFVIQGGGFTPDLQMKPTEPPIPLEIVPGLTHIDGAIAMARTDVLDSATSQFYICDGAQHGLDGDYAVFGVLIEGFAVRDAISAVKVDADGLPLEDVILMSATCE
jgi:cyclophilin family peptidyl-prolyl cis-trans isomerase